MAVLVEPAPPDLRRGDGPGELGPRRAEPGREVVGLLELLVEVARARRDERAAAAGAPRLAGLDGLDGLEVVRVERRRELLEEAPDRDAARELLLHGGDGEERLRRVLVAAAPPGQDKSAKFPTSKAPLSASFHSFRLIFGRAIISRNGLDAWMFFP